MDQRSMTPEIRTFFWGVGCAFSAIAGLVLFLFPERTDSLFAWTIVRGDTAAFIGACFLGFSLVSLLSFSSSTWAGARVCFIGTLTFVTAMAVATLLHLNQFHYGSDEPVALVAAWGWTAVYLVAPIASGLLLARQLAEPGRDDGPPTTPIIPGLRYLYAAQGVVLSAVAVVMFVAPSTAKSVWPWPLDPLPARAIGALLLGFGVMLLGAARENAAERLEPLCAPCWWLAVLTGMAVTRFDKTLDIGSVRGLVFCVVAVSLLIGGLAGEMAARRLRPPGAA
jgi:hypothetical protein